MSDLVEFPDPSTRKGGRPWVGKRNDLVEFLRAIFNAIADVPRCVARALDPYADCPNHPGYHVGRRS